MKTRIKTVFAILLCAVMLAPTGLASAGGSESTSGYADGGAKFYKYPRDITNPAAPGAEVAFYQTSGNPGLFLGAWGCPGGWSGGPMYKQSVGSWQPVHYTTTPVTFCVFTSSNSGPGNFWGVIAWD